MGNVPQMMKNLAFANIMVQTMHYVLEIGNRKNRQRCWLQPLTDRVVYVIQMKMLCRDEQGDATGYLRY